MQDKETIWTQILDKLELRVSAVSFSLWIKPTKIILLDNKSLIISTSTITAKNQILRNFIDKISDCTNEVLGYTPDIMVLDPKEEDNFIKENQVDKKNIGKSQEKNPFKEKYTFDNFVVGKSNQFVYAAARTVAEHPGQKYNPLFIYGGVGLGKTHLLHAIGNYLREFNPELKLMYVTTEQFTNDYIESLTSSSTKSSSNTDFRSKYRNLDVLMVDDIQFIANKKSTQEEFFHTFNDLYQNNKQIIISSDRPPKEISTLEERLRSRFASGLMHDIQSPDLETRIAILRKKTQLENYSITEDAINYIAERVDSNIRELEEKLSEVYFQAVLLGKKTATIDEAQEIFSDTDDTLHGQLTPEKIITTVCNYFNVSKDDILGKKRNKEFVEPRMVAIYFIYELLGLPLKSIGKLFGGRDHTTIINARDKITEENKNNKKIQAIIKDILDIFNKNPM